MLVACWSSKGGSGTTVVASSIALLLARDAPDGALVVDLAGDVPAALGLAEPGGPGLSGWLAAGADVPPDALVRLESPAGPGLSLLARGNGPLQPDRADVLAALLGADPRPVVADCGADPSGAALAVAASATRSVLVTRACFLALRRALSAPLRPSEVVLVTEPGRSLGRADIEDCLGAPVVAEVSVDPLVARAVDAGLLAQSAPPDARPRARAVLPDHAVGDLAGRVHRRLLEHDPAAAGDRRLAAAAVRDEHPLLAEAEVRSIAGGRHRPRRGARTTRARAGRPDRQRDHGQRHGTRARGASRSSPLAAAGPRSGRGRPAHRAHPRPAGPAAPTARARSPTPGCPTVPG